MQDDAQQRAVHLEVSVIFDEAHAAEFVHEGADAGSGRADHFGEGFLANFCDDRRRATILAEISEEQKKSRKPLLAGIEELINQIRFHTNVTREQIRHEEFGEGKFPCCLEGRQCQ